MQIHHSRFNGCLPGESELDDSLGLLPARRVWKKIFEHKWHKFFCEPNTISVAQPINSVIALKPERTTSHRQHVQLPGLILQSSPIMYTRLLMEAASLLPLCWLSDTGALLCKIIKNNTSRLIAWLTG